MKPTVAALIATATLSLTQVPALAQTIKLGTLAPEGSPWYNILRDRGNSPIPHLLGWRRRRRAGHGPKD